MLIFTLLCLKLHIPKIRDIKLLDEVSSSQMLEDFSIQGMGQCQIKNALTIQVVTQYLDLLS